MNNRVILLVGHCGPDAYMLRSAVGSAAQGYKIEMIGSESAMRERLPEAGLVLVNRALDGDFESEDGIALIGRYSGEHDARFMLVSNYEEAQARAEGAGAAPGFGKTELRSERTRARIEAALSGAAGKEAS